MSQQNNPQPTNQQGPVENTLRPTETGTLSKVFNKFKGSKIAKYLGIAAITVTGLTVAGHFMTDHTPEGIEITDLGKDNLLSNRIDAIQISSFYESRLPNNKILYADCTYVTDGNMSMNLGCENTEKFSVGIEHIKKGKTLSELENGLNFIEVSGQAFRDGNSRECYAFKSDKSFIDMGCEISNNTDPSLDTEIFRSKFLTESKHLDNIPNGVSDINAMLSEDGGPSRSCMIIKDERSFLKNLFNAPTSLGISPKTEINLTYDCETRKNSSLNGYVINRLESDRTLSNTKTNNKYDIEIDRTINYNQPASTHLEVLTGNKGQMMLRRIQKSNTL